MKKSLLTAAFAAAILSSNAQTNFVVNGDFEDTNFVQKQVWDWTEAGQNLKELPGWDLSLDDWCVLARIVAPEADDELVFEGNKQCLHIYRFDDNGWTDGKVSQVVKGLTGGETYTLGAVAAISVGTTVDWDDPYFKISVLPLDANGEEDGSPVLFELKNEEIAEAEYWCAVEKEFKAPASGCLRVTIAHNNTKWSGNHSEGYWMDIDDVAIMTPDDYKAYVEGKALASVRTLQAGDVVEGVYNLNGVKIADTLEAVGTAKGLYIVKTDKGTKKVIR